MPKRRLTASGMFLRASSVGGPLTTTLPSLAAASTSCVQAAEAGAVWAGAVWAGAVWAAAAARVGGLAGAEVAGSGGGALDVQAANPKPNRPMPLVAAKRSKRRRLTSRVATSSTTEIFAYSIALPHVVVA